MPRILKDITINEVASVDRGAGRGVKLLLMKRDDDSDAYWKREFSQEQRNRAAASGHALGDGSFPIENTSDLKNAIQAIGRAKDPAKAKAHIKSRARALGASDLIPDTWKRDSGEVDMTQEEINALVAKASKDAAEAAVKPVAEALAKARHELNVAKMSDAHQQYMDNCDMNEQEQKRFAAMTPAERDAHIQKNPLKKKEAPVDQAELAKRDAQITELTKQLAENGKELAAIRLEKAQADFKKRAAELGLTKDGDGELMRKAFNGDAEAQAAFEKRQAEVIKAKDAQIKTGVLFAEFGTNKGANGDAYDTLTAKAEELRKSGAKTADGKPLTPQQAFAKVYEDPANAELVAQHKQEDARKRLTVVAAA